MRARPNTSTHPLTRTSDEAFAAESNVSREEGESSSESARLDGFEAASQQKVARPTRDTFSVNGSWSLDRNHLHTQNTQALPLYSDQAEGLVRIAANNLEFRARVYGMNNDGPGIVMLHGFPGTSIMYDQAAKEAAAKGYRVIAYDQRGTSPGARPEGKEHYEITDYLGDLDAITDAVGFDDYHLVGHDVGAVVAWAGAMASPDKVRSLNTMSIPNLQVLELRAYMKAFAIPLLPEVFLRFNKSKKFQSMLPQNRSQAEHDEYRALFREPGSLTANLNFYRGVGASLEYMHEHLNGPIQTPTRFMYGEGEGWVNDQYLREQNASMQAGTSLDVVEIKDAGDTGHFIIENQQDAVMDGMLLHIDANR